MAIFQEIDWSRTDEEAISILKSLIRFKTVNPPGDEKPAAQFLAELLRKEGLEPEVIESAPNRANLVCRIKGSGDKPPLLLNGHLDVVQAEEDKWTVPPFEAMEKDGVLYGRGALDMKNMVTMCLMCMLIFKRSGAALKRDLIFCAVADEEAGGEHGSRFMIDHHPDKVRAEYSLSEIGGFSLEIEGTRFYPVEVAEKGVCWIRITTRGRPGHGSIPDPQGALLKAAAIADTLGKKRLPQHNVQASVRFIQELSDKLAFPKNKIFKMLLNPAASDLLLDRVFPDQGQAQAIAAMLHNTANPTVIRAGDKTNVIPSEARLEVDGRLLPGFTSRQFIDEVRALIGDEPEIEVLLELSPTEAPAADPIMQTLQRAILRHDPGAVVVPNLVTGMTDATHWKRLGIKCYGFSPVKLTEGMSFKDLIHGHDERIPLDGFRFGIRVLLEAVAELVL